MNNPMIGSGLLPGSVSGILDLDSVSQRHHPPPNPHLHPIPAAAGLDCDHHLGSLFDPSGGAATSDDEERFPGSSAGDENGYNSHSQPASGAGGSKKASPWQRMKWTDEVVRLLISVVAHVGDHDDDALDAFDGTAGTKRKHGAALQKKGKWKKVSELMSKKGFNVSPQQCEDKFNDLNKRYKRLNEILGRGTSCQVVENPLLLDSMHISPKAKDDVRKILSSKHLFYREMCAYHNGQRIPNCHDANVLVSGVPKVVPPKDENGPVDDEEEEEDEEDDNGDRDDRSDDIGKRGLESFRVEMDNVLQDKTKSLWEQREWFKRRALQLEEDRVEIEAEALELEKRHFKWQRFRSKKDRELERLRLENERLRLENEHMILQVRQKELELHIIRSGEPLNSTGLRMDVEQLRDLME
ncbi:hypothetical protein Cni_G22435 [Canna indica]|uniref:Myb/SANT-like DNA-binding domain-containing protein n=1 Tax=Canna indica TaxID=4628 RepID=A0AAQ3KR96_9LILI|nr:hypothetical protein Cni_G22435 [Canna indica]